MGGEGSMAAANNSLKNNRSLLSKRKAKGALEGSYSGVELKEFPEATPKQLEEIKEKMQKEIKKARLKLIIASTLFFLSLFVAIWYLL